MREADYSERNSLFLKRWVAYISGVEGFVGVLAHGSSTTGQADAFSDIDLICVTEPEWRPSGEDLEEIVSGVGGLVICKRVGIGGAGGVYFCLFEPGFLRVDMMFSSLASLGGLAQRPDFVWDGSQGRIAAKLRDEEFRSPQLDNDDLDHRFWLCVEQATRRLARGEYLEVLDVLAVLRRNFLGPMLFRRANLPPYGVRRIEALLPSDAALLGGVVATPGAADCTAALRRAVVLYNELRKDFPPRHVLHLVEREIQERLQAFEAQMV